MFCISLITGFIILLCVFSSAFVIICACAYRQQRHLKHIPREEDYGPGDTPQRLLASDFPSLFGPIKQLIVWVMVEDERRFSRLALAIFILAILITLAYRAYLFSTLPA